MIRAAAIAVSPHGLRFPAACGIIFTVLAQWEIAGPRRNDYNGTIQHISAPCKRPTASRSICYPFARRGFCKWR